MKFHNPHNFDGPGAALAIFGWRLWHRLGHDRPTAASNLPTTVEGRGATRLPWAELSLAAIVGVVLWHEWPRMAAWQHTYMIVAISALAVLWLALHVRGEKR